MQVPQPDVEALVVVVLLTERMHENTIQKEQLEAVRWKHQHESYISFASLFKHNSLLTTC